MLPSAPAPNRSISRRALFALLASAGLALAVAAGDEDESSVASGRGRIEYGPPQRLADLADQRIDESSGLAASRRREDILWTHNDSGDEPRVFAVDCTGATLAAVRVAGASAVDWEDMASFRDGEKSFLLLADVGDNGRRRQHGTLYVVEEPDVDAVQSAPAQAVNFQYENGACDCEAAAVDPTSRTVLLIEKTILPRCQVFALPLPVQETAATPTARAVATLPVSMVTAMDVSADGLRAIVLTYGDALEYRRAAAETWEKAFSREGRRIAMPSRRQGEAVCYGIDGQSLFLTSEKLPAPLWEVKAHEASLNPQPLPPR